MRNDDLLDKSPAGRPATYMSQAAVSLAMRLAASDPDLMNRIMRTERRPSTDTATMRMLPGGVIYNEAYVVKTVSQRGEDVRVLADELLALFK